MSRCHVSGGTNWDKPLSRRIVCGTGFWTVNFNEYHGTNFDCNWSGLVKILGASENSGPTEFYEAYLDYCFFMSTPLGKALA